MLANILAQFALSYITKRAYDFAVGEPDKPYMLRWWWIPRNRFFNVYIHVFLRDDDDRALHDHPWASLSLLCKGELIEHYRSPNGAYPRRRTIKAFDWTYRPASFAHRIAVPSQPTAPVTIFITGPRIRNWGFHCPQGWKRWQDFVGENKGTVGAGCGETDSKETK